MVYDMGFTTLALPKFRLHDESPASERQGESAASCSEAKPTWKRWRNMGETWGSQLTGNIPPHFSTQMFSDFPVIIGCHFLQLLITQIPFFKLTMMVKNCKTSCNNSIMWLIGDCGHQTIFFVWSKKCICFSLNHIHVYIHLWYVCMCIYIYYIYIHTIYSYTKYILYI